MDYAERRRLQFQKTEEAILQAALELSREKSFDKVSIRDICKKAGITTGAFYHHFTAKEELLVKGFAPLDRYMEEALARRGEEPPRERLLTILSIYAHFMEDQGWELVSRYYQHRLGSPDAPPMDPSRFTHRAILGCLRQAEAEGLLLPGHPPEWVAEFLFRHFRGVVVDWVIHRGSYPLWPKLEQDYILCRQFFEA